MNKQFQYIEIIETKTGKVVCRMDVSGKSTRSIERIDDGVNINLNHKDFHTATKDSDVALPTDSKELEKENDKE